MSDPETDDLLRKRFAASREADRATAPSFEAVRARRTRERGSGDTLCDPMVETRRGGGDQTRWAFPISVGVHVVIIGLLVGISYLVVETVKEHEAMINFFASAAPPPPSPPPPPPPAASRPQTTTQLIDPQEILQPRETPEELTITEETSEGGGEDVGVVGGVPDGVHGGVLHGVVGSRGVSGVLGASPSTGPIVVTPGMEKPVLEHKVVPEYPEMARQARMQGSVIVQAVIEADGTVSDVTVLRASNPVFTENAVSALKQWKYRPAMQNGRPVAVYFTVVVEFLLH